MSKKLSEEIYRFSMDLLQVLGIESYPALLKDVKKLDEENISLTIIMPVEKKLTEALLKVIKSERSSRENEILLIPARRWSLELLNLAPDEITSMVIERLRGAMKKDEKTQYID
jgi:hypothetical protein